MDKIPFLISSLQEYAFRFQMWRAAMSLRHDYETNVSLREFNALDGDGYVDLASDA